LPGSPSAPASSGRVSTMPESLPFASTTVWESCGRQIVIFPISPRSRFATPSSILRY